MKLPTVLPCPIEIEGLRKRQRGSKPGFRTSKAICCTAAKAIVNTIFRKWKIGRRLDILPAGRKLFQKYYKNLSIIELIRLFPLRQRRTGPQDIEAQLSS